MMTKTEKIVAVVAAIAIVLIYRRRAYALGVGSNNGETFDINWGRVLRTTGAGAHMANEWWFPEANFGLGKWGGFAELEKYGAHQPSLRAGYNVT